MRCKACDWDIQDLFNSRFPGEDYCQVCEEFILELISERNLMDKEKDREMCPECAERAKVDGLPWCSDETCPHWGGDNA